MRIPRLVGALVVTALAAGSVLTLGVGSAFALPAYVVQSGSVSAAVSADTLTITQQTTVATLAFPTGFVLGPGESIVINTPTADSITALRITDGSIASIQGDITSNGSLFVLDEDGVEVTAGGSIVVGGDLVVASGDATVAEIEDFETTFTVGAANPPVEFADGSLISAGRAAAIVAPSVDAGGFLSTASGPLHLWSVDSFTYQHLTLEFGAGPLTAAGSIAIPATGYLRANSAAIDVRVHSTGEIVHDGVTIANGAGEVDSEATVRLTGPVSSSALDSSTVPNLDVPPGDRLGATAFVGAAEFTAGSVATASSGQTVAATSSVIITSWEVEGLSASILQVGCGLEGDPLAVHFAGSEPEYGGVSIVPDITVYETPNLPGVVVDGLGTVFFNQQTVTESDGFQFLSTDAIRVVPDEGEPFVIGRFACAVPAETVLPATGASPAAPAIAGALILLAGTVLLIARRRVA